ncbi:uncharacterized protein DUF11, partial [Flavobacterium glaciei]
MNKFYFNYNKIYQIFILFLFLLSINTGFSQTKGLILRDGNGNIPPLSSSPILDPNGDGFVSSTSSGFGTNDVGAGISEIPYLAITPLTPEALGDLRRGPTGGFSEFVPDANGKSVYVYSDGTNLMVRFRIGSIIPGAKGYSLLIDTDGLFGATDPNYSASNPGFEYELVYETGFSVTVYNVNSGTSCIEVAKYDLLTNPNYAQTSIAATNNNNDLDYFYDFYVPLSAFTGAGPITNSTPLRFNAITVMAPKSATCGPVSDGYSFDVNAQPPCTLQQIKDGTCNTDICTAPPVVNTGLSTADTSISGTWTKSSFSTNTNATINVYRNDILIGSTSATSGNSWTLTGVLLSNGDVITAKAVATGESMCLVSNKVTISTCGTSNTSPCPVIECMTSRGIVGTGVNGATIKIYNVTSSGITLVAQRIVLFGRWFWDGGNGGGPDVCKSGANNAIPSGTYYITQTLPGRCESNCNTYECVSGSGNTSTPTITTTTLYTTSTQINGTAVTSSTVRLYLNEELKATTTATGGVFSFNIGSISTSIGDVFSIRSSNGVRCISNPARITVSCFVYPPIISSNETNNIQAGIPITGTSYYPNTTVSVYNNLNNSLIQTITTDANGNWQTTVNAVANTSYYATIVTSCGTSIRSIIATALNPSTQNCGVINGPIYDNSTAVSGTLATAIANTTVNLYLDDSLIGSVVTNTATWTIPVNTTAFNRLNAGGVLSYGITESGNLELKCTSKITVECSKPAIPIIQNSSITIAKDYTATFTITNSDTNTIYTLEDASGIDYSISVFGTGGSINLQSFPFNTSGTYNLKITALNITSVFCSQSTNVTLSVQTPVDLAVLKTVNNNNPNFGSNVLFTITATNNGPVNATGVTVSDLIPNGYTVISVTPSIGTWSAPNWSIGNLSNTSSATLTIEARVNLTGNYSNTANISGNEIDLITSNNSSTSTPVPNNSLIDAVNDTGTAVIGLIGGTSFTNVLGNDTLGGTPVNPAAINISFVNSTNLGVTLSGTNVVVAAGTPAGNYQLTYRICEILNPSNCSTAVVSVPVGTPVIDAVNDTGSSVVGFTGGTSLSNVLSNDTLGGVITTSDLVNTFFVSSTHTGITLSGTSVLVAAGTPAGNYNLTYRICEKLNPTNCDNATVSVIVTAAAIDAINDAGTVVYGDTDEIAFTNVLSNDKLNDAPVLASQVTTTFVSATNAGITLSGNNVIVAAGTPAGSYSLVYRICEILNPSNCDNATVSVTVTPKTATVVANNQNKVYGDANPTLTAVVNGAVNRDTINYTLATTATQFSNVGEYPIEVTLGSNPNYTVVATDAILTITPKVLGVTVVADNQNKVYGDANPTLT